MSTWMINGPGQAVFLGKGGASQFDPTGQVSPGSNYIPDEVAKMIVKESGLRKSDTIPKKVIIEYLESMGLSAGLAPDVAIVLRNMYGVTPTFDEGTLYSRSGALIEELTGVVNENYPAPFRIDAPEILNEINEVGQFLLREYMESTDAEYDVVLEHLSALGPHDFLDIYEFYEWVGPNGFAYLADLVEHGPEGLADEVLEGLCCPDGVMSEDVEYHLSEMDIPNIKPLSKDKQDARSSKREAGMKKTAAKGVSDRSQLKKAYKDRSGSHKEDPLAQRQATSKRTGVSAMKSMGKGERSARSDRGKMRAADSQRSKDAKMTTHLAKGAEAGAADYKKKMADKQMVKSAKRDAMKDKGKKAIGLLGKVAGGAAKLGGKAIAGTAKAAVKTAGAVTGLAARATGHVLGNAASAAKKSYQAKAQTAHSGDGGGQAAASSSKKSSQGSASAAPKKPSILQKVGHAIGKFGASVKKGYKSDTPGVQSQRDKGGEAKSAPDKEKVHGTKVAESYARQGELLSEMNSVLGHGGPEKIPEPSDVLSRLESRDIVGQAVIEALSQLDWDEVSQIASVALIPVNEAMSLVNAYYEGKDTFFHEWRDVSSRVNIPSPLTKGTFSLLADLTIDESIVPKLVAYSVEALRGAGPDVIACVEDAYPELGKTVYGPAGDPKEGPEMAKKWLTPHACSTDSPSDDRQVMKTRMFSDPSVRKKDRASKLSAVMDVLRGMQKASGELNVDPEGMFLNTYRDLHREKVRYS
jgi:hypothetical protein